MDFYNLEQEAIGLYQDGEFTAAKHLFAKLEQTSVVPSKEVHSFNKTCCVAAEGTEIAAALSDLLANYEASPSPLGLYNISVCLLNLNRPDLTLAILAKIIREDDENKDNSLSTDKINQVEPDQLALLLMHCMKKLDDDASISRRQCKLMERLLMKYKNHILKFTDEFVWRRNLAHILFIMDTRYEHCASLLESLLPNDMSHHLLEETDPVVLGNLCISYILTNRKRDAEDLLKRIEQEEESRSGAPSLTSSPAKKSTANSVPVVDVNLALGTLDCVENDYEFGLKRIFQSLRPDRLTCQAWTQVKRCILSALDKHCKQMIHIQDDLFDQMISFLIECETHGLLLKASEQIGVPEGRNSIAYEARHLRSILLTIVHD